MLSRIATMMWGNFESSDELKKFGKLSMILGLIIGAYWAMRPIKDSIFDAIVGFAYQPHAKILSLCVIVPLVILYGKLIDMFPRHKLFYAFISIYAAAAFAFALIFMHPQWGLANMQSDPTRLVGWFWYIYVESFGSLIVALFWAITTDTTLPDSARRGFPMIALAAQTGNMVGPWFINAKRLGFAHSGPVVAVIGTMLVAIGLMFFYFMKSTPQRLLAGYHTGETADAEPGFLEGLKLLVSKGYLLGMFAILSFYEIIVTVLDNHFKNTVMISFDTELERSAELARYGTMTGVVGVIAILLGINSIQRWLGVRKALFLLPALVVAAVLLIKIYPWSLAVGFWIMVVSKAVNYALNGPLMKQLYIPTTKDTKYKAQAWIEMFGSRGGKGAASGINIFRGMFTKNYGPVDGVMVFLTFNAFISMGMIAVWLVAIMFVSKAYNKAIAENRVVC